MGVGSHLKSMLSWFEPVGGCSICQKKAKVLDANSPEWAELNIETVTNWLMKAAKKRYSPVNIPGISQITRMVAKGYVLEAIRLAKADLVKDSGHR